MTAPFPTVLADMRALLLQFPELEDDEALRADMLEGATDFHGACSVLLNALQETATLHTALKARIKEMRERGERLEMRQESLRAMLFKIMEAGNLTKVALPEATLSIRNGPPRVVIIDEDDLPEQYVRVKREADKRGILEALKAGETILGASLANGEPCLSVRTT